MPSPSPAHFRELADGLQGAIDRAFSPSRLTNTPKRNRQAGAARIEGRRLQRTQAALRRLADLHEAGTVPPGLAGVTSKVRAYELLASRVEHSGGYYDCGRDHNEPRDQTPEALALWQLATEAAPIDMRAERLRASLDAAKLANIPGYFPTPAPLIARMIELAELPAGPFSVLEPSAGHGAIADAVKEAAPGAAVIACEANNTLRSILTDKGYTLAGSGDFMGFDPSPVFDRVLMNPPFERGQDINHTLHAWNFLRPRGILCGILGRGAFYRDDARCRRFRAWLDDVNAERYDIPSGAFHESGTNVATTMILAVKL